MYKNTKCIIPVETGFLMNIIDTNILVSTFNTKFEKDASVAPNFITVIMTYPDHCALSHLEAVPLPFSPHCRQKLNEQTARYC